MHWQPVRAVVFGPDVEVLAGQSVQTVNEVLSAYLPAEQTEQAALPSVPLNFPATHPLQVLPSYPALHWQLDCDMLPGGLKNAPGFPQKTHVLAACPLAYLPDMQSTHDGMP